MLQGIRRLLALATVFAAAFAIVFLIRNGPAGVRDLFAGDEEAPRFRPEDFTLPDKAPLELDDVELLSRLNAEYATLTAAVVPSVVSIDTTGLRAQRTLDGLGRSTIRAVPTQGQGSGVIVSEEGHVVTNDHVIRGQRNIQVRLHGGETYPAILIGEDPLLDIAVLKIEGDGDFTPLKFGDSSEVRLGQLVFAIGNPFGLGETVTQGIISAVDRSVSDTQRDLFQTDAAINPGNSGGPLVNLQGEIIGINSSIYTPDRANPGFQGVGFSIPSNDVRDTLYTILERGRPIRGYLGVRMVELDPRLNVLLGYQGKGAVVATVGTDSPAAAAGLQPRDVIVRYGDQDIESIAQLITLVQRTRVGKTVPLEVWRDGKMITLEATIDESRPEAIQQMESEAQGATRDRQEVLESVGVRVRDLGTRERIAGYRGVLVTGVAADSLAAGQLEVNDLVYGVNRDRIDSSTDFYLHLAASVPVQSTTLQLLRGRSRMQATLPPLPRKDDDPAAGRD